MYYVGHKFRDIFDEFNKNLSTLNYEKVRADPKNQNWTTISYFKKLTKEFIIEFAEYIDFQAVMYNKQISQDIKDYCRMFI